MERTKKSCQRGHPTLSHIVWSTYHCRPPARVARQPASGLVRTDKDYRASSGVDADAAPAAVEGLSEVPLSLLHTDPVLTVWHITVASREVNQTLHQQLKATVSAIVIGLPCQHGEFKKDRVSAQYNSCLEHSGGREKDLHSQVKYIWLNCIVDEIQCFHGKAVSLASLLYDCFGAAQHHSSGLGKIIPWPKVSPPHESSTSRPRTAK